MINLHLQTEMNPFFLWNRKLVKVSLILFLIFYIVSKGFAQSAPLKQYKGIAIIEANKDFLFIIDQILDVETKCRYFNNNICYEINVEYFDRNNTCVEIISFDSRIKTDRSENWIGCFKYQNIKFYTNKIIPQFLLTQKMDTLSISQKRYIPSRVGTEEIMIIEDNEFSVWRITFNDSHYNIAANKNICFSTNEIKGVFPSSVKSPVSIVLKCKTTAFIKKQEPHKE